MFWISDKETFVTADEFGHDLEHVEVLIELIMSVCMWMFFGMFMYRGVAV